MSIRLKMEKGYRIFCMVAFSPTMICSSVVLAEESVEDVVSAQIRSQGYVCNKPMTARELPSDSEPEEAAWLLQCANAVYEVRLIPHMAAKVKVVKALD
jgi:hypothetical protein